MHQCGCVPRPPFPVPFLQRVHHPSAFVIKKSTESRYLLAAHAKSRMLKSPEIRLGAAWDQACRLFYFGASRRTKLLPRVRFLIISAPCGIGPPAAVGPPYKGSADAPRTKTSLGVSNIAPRVPAPL